MSAYAELGARFLIRKTSSVSLLSEFTIRRSGFSDLAAEFRPAQDIADLTAEMIIQNASSSGLKSKLIVRHTSSTTLQSKFRVAHWADLACEFVIRRTVIQAPQLKAHFTVVRTYAELLQHLTIRQSTSVEVTAHFMPRRSDSESLLSAFILRQSVSLGLQAGFVISRSATADLKAILNVQHYVDLPAEFNVVRTYSPSPIYGGNLKDWINYIAGVGSGFIMTPEVSNDPTQKIGGLNSFKLNSIFSTGRYDGIRFGYSAYPAMQIPDYNYLNLPAKFFIQIPFADLVSKFNVTLPSPNSPVTIDLLNEYNASLGLSPSEEYLFYLRGRYFAFENRDSKLYFKSSGYHDYQTWGSRQYVVDLPEDVGIAWSYGYSITADEDYIHLVIFVGDETLLYKRGTPQNSGTILWDTDTITWDASLWDPTHKWDWVLSTPTIIIDSEGYPWVACVGCVEQYTALLPDYQYYALCFHSITKDGTWTEFLGPGIAKYWEWSNNPPGTPETFCPNPFRFATLSGGRMYLFMIGGGTLENNNLYGYLYDGVWGALESILPGNAFHSYGSMWQPAIRIVGIDNDIHLIYVAESDHFIYHMKYDGAWAAATLAASPTSGDSNFTTSILKNKKLALLWNNTHSDNYINLQIYDNIQWSIYPAFSLSGYHIDYNELFAPLKLNQQTLGFIWPSIQTYDIRLMFFSMEVPE